MYRAVEPPTDVMSPLDTAKIAFIGSHSVRKTNAVHSFAGAVGRTGRSVEVGARGGAVQPPRYE